MVFIIIYQYQLEIDKPININIEYNKIYENYAINCNKFIQEILSKKVKDNGFINNCEIAISNYVNDEIISKYSWLYGTLCCLEPNYERYLSRIFSKKLLM